MVALTISLKQKCVVVIGGGKIAERRVKKLLHEEAVLFVISPLVTTEIENLANQGKLYWIERKFQPDDLKGAFLIIAATNDAELNKTIATMSDPNHQLTNVVSNFEEGNVIFPASEQRGRLTISVTTNGGNPKTAADLCNKFINQIDNSVIENLDTQFYERKKK